MDSNARDLLLDRFWVCLDDRVAAFLKIFRQDLLIVVFKICMNKSQVLPSANAICISKLC